MDRWRAVLSFVLHTVGACMRMGSDAAGVCGSRLRRVAAPLPRAPTTGPRFTSLHPAAALPPLPAGAQGGQPDQPD